MTPSSSPHSIPIAPTPQHILKAIKSHYGDICSRMSISSLFTVARKWKQLRSPSNYENTIIVPHTCTMEFDLAVKKNKVVKLASKLIELGTRLWQKINLRRAIADAAFVNHSSESLDPSISLVVTTRTRKVERDHV